MQSLRRYVLGVAMLALLGMTAETPAFATDVDGPDDCTRELNDFGDAPENVDAYPGVPGRFPTCVEPGMTGTQELFCAPISTAPGPTGFVLHVSSPLYPNYWLGCGAGAPLGIDPEGDGKTNATGASQSACRPDVLVDCFESAFGLTFGQDECYGSDDATLASPVSFDACSQASVQFQTYSCSQADHFVYVNVLIDWNQDGDWNDNFECPGVGCAYEWAVKNQQIRIDPGCDTHSIHSFLTGPYRGNGWMRITISDDPASDDFPWDGSAQTLEGALFGGETEDYPVTITGDVQDFGDAPEESQAYPGVPGHFPTCLFASTPGTQESACAPISSNPGPTGYVEHRWNPSTTPGFWLGCGNPTGASNGFDDEPDGKMNDTGGAISACDQTVAVDCGESWWLPFGQDECYGDLVDAGIQAPITFTACTPASVTFDAFNASAADRVVFLNILVDWNRDGDWNDNFDCPSVGCAYEWAVKNQQITLSPGCQTLVSPSFLAGPLAGADEGEGWLRITLTPAHVSNGFPWEGSVPEHDGFFDGGETEDYPVAIVPGDTCVVYHDFGDAPEKELAYPGVQGRFPTCIAGTSRGTQEIFCTPRSTPPNTTGYVEHVRNAGDAAAIWLGCWAPGVDHETDGKMNDDGGPNSYCDQALQVDCVESWWLMWGQDECYGDGVDAGIHAPMHFQACQLSTVTFDASSCGPLEVEAYLNILVDWNQDGDWNDNFDCAAAGCAHEWAVKNVPVLLAPGCQALTSPPFLAGPVSGLEDGFGWLRITITLAPVHDDFPWAGSVGETGDVYKGGETEDYPVTIESNPCDIGYEDFGDAPEDIPAYPGGIMGRFPTCLSTTPAGTQEIECGLPRSLPPGSTGFVMHVALPGDPWHFWLGCGPVYPSGVDAEHDGKTEVFPIAPLTSHCDPTVVPDCIEPAFGMTFAQDECVGDGVDAGVTGPFTFPLCAASQVNFDATNCGFTEIEVYLNILIDWNDDGDWNDNILCADGTCAYEWAVKNHPIVLAPGCQPYVSPSFTTGPNGLGWMRVTLTPEPVLDDFPWNGSAGMAGEAFRGGETEDYPTTVPPLGLGEPDVPNELALAPAWPNPGRTSTLVRYDLPRQAHVALDVYDVTGRKVRTLASGEQPAGQHAVRWDYRNDDGVRVPAGIYLVTLAAEGRVLTQRTIHIE